MSHPRVSSLAEGWWFSSLLLLLEGRWFLCDTDCTSLKMIFRACSRKTSDNWVPGCLRIVWGLTCFPKCNRLAQIPVMIDLFVPFPTIMYSMSHLWHAGVLEREEAQIPNSSSSMLLIWRRFYSPGVARCGAVCKPSSEISARLE